MLYSLRQHKTKLRQWIARFRDEDWYMLEFLGRREFYRRAFTTLKFNRITGDYAEFGYGPKTFTYAFDCSRRAGLNCRLWAFDSFEGLPDVGEQDTDPRYYRGVRRVPLTEAKRYLNWLGLAEGLDYSVVVGFYHESLERSGLPDDICLAYVDCNLYTSTMDVLRFLGPRLKNGMVIAFDDYFCFSPAGASCEKRALDKFFAESSWRLVPYMQFAVYGMAYFVEEGG